MDHSWKNSALYEKKNVFNQLSVFGALSQESHQGVLNLIMIIYQLNFHINHFIPV